MMNVKLLMNVKLPNKGVQGKGIVLCLLMMLSTMSSLVVTAASVGTAFYSGTTSLGVIAGSGNFNNDIP
ncbi:MAG: hypothetical protein RQ982_05005 [Gammaproteobacteria bacterium]|nr:hypothetical protein [Gammaproteobacteria bacterium]